MVVESAERAVGEVSAAQVRAVVHIVCLASNCSILIICSALNFFIVYLCCFQFLYHPAARSIS